MSVAFAWLRENDMRMDTPVLYVPMLKYKPVGSFAGGRYSYSLDALGIPDYWSKENLVLERAHDLFAQACAFIICHELGHIYHGDAGNKAAGVTPEMSQKMEESADAFALEMLRRSKTFPYGPVFFFVLLSYQSPTRIDYTSDVAWRQHVANATHPVTSHRLTAMADGLKSAEGSYLAAGTAKDQYESSVIALYAISSYLDRTSAQQELRSKAMETNVTQLLPHKATLQK